MKTVIITGSRGNLGSAAINRFKAGNYNIIATVSPGKDHELRESGFRPDVYPVDLSDEKAAGEFVEQVIHKYGRIDSYLSLVGGYLEGTLESTSSTDIDKMNSINFKTAYHIARPVYMQMKKQLQGGSLLFIGSKPGLYPKEGWNSLAYALSKSLLFHLAKIINAGDANNKVTATVIVPGTMDTPANRTGMPKADFSGWVKPEEIAEMMFRISENSGATDRIVELYDEHLKVIFK
jgi:NAD(P)-dependent dehydrogenase (short-subunit alcohol dehydrogenase family)